MYAANKVEDSELQAKLPEPKGFKVLIAVPELDGKTEGGVIMPDALKSMEETASIIGFVIKTGPEAYTDKERFPSGPYSQCGHILNNREGISQRWLKPYRFCL